MNRMTKNSKVFGVNTKTLTSTGNTYQILEYSILYKPGHCVFSSTCKDYKNELWNKTFEQLEFLLYKKKKLKNYIYLK